MPRITKPLTDSQIQAAKVPATGATSLFDGDGLQLDIKASGSKLWRFRYYRPVTNKRTMLAFGAYPAVSLAAARKRRAEALDLLANGKDPQVVWEEQRAAAATAATNTFEAVARKWLISKSKRKKETGQKITAGYLEDITRSLERHVFPYIGKKPIAEITPDVYEDILRPLEAAGKYETVRRLCQRISEINRYAIRKRFLTVNAASELTEEFDAPVKKNLPAIAPAELPEFLADLSTASISLQTRCLIEFQLHTMTRPNEAAGAKWSEIDKEAKFWRIPAERMKKRKEHTIPLTDEVMAILATLEPISGHREYVFPSIKDPRKPMNEQTANAAIKRILAGKYKGRLVAHGLRSIGSTLLNEQGFDPDIIEAALAHVDQNAVRRAYNRAEYLERRRVMMIWWSGHIVEAAGGSGSVAGSRRGLRAVG